MCSVENPQRRKRYKQVLASSRQCLCLEAIRSKKHNPTGAAKFALILVQIFGKEIRDFSILHTFLLTLIVNCF